MGCGGAKMIDNKGTNNSILPPSQRAAASELIQPTTMKSKAAFDTTMGKSGEGSSTEVTSLPSNSEFPENLRLDVEQQSGSQGLHDESSLIKRMDETEIRFASSEKAIEPEIRSGLFYQPTEARPKRNRTDILLSEALSEVARLRLELEDSAKINACLSTEIESWRMNYQLKSGTSGSTRLDGNAALEDKQEQIAKVQARVEKGLLRRNEATLRTIFEGFCQGRGTLHRADLLAALREFNSSLGEDDLIEMIRLVNVDSDAPISFEHYKQLVNLPSMVEKWIHSLPTSVLLADAISALSPTSKDLRPVSEMSLDHIKSICEGLLQGLQRVLAEYVALLRASYRAMDAKAKHANSTSASKFQVDKMHCGTIDDYHAGLEGRTGFPNLQFKKAMETEHCDHKSADTHFITPNYNITSTPRIEYGIVALENECRHMSHGRKIRNVKTLLSLKIVIEARLSEDEVIAIVLYTGPMFMVINAILRRYPPDLYALFGAEGKGFSTTIFVLVSAVQKLSRSVALPDGLLLYRGLGGTLDLPDSFFKCDTQGRKGFAEWGFMSTTANKEVALQYSGVKEGKPCATVLVIRVGAVDRGACIQELSQYPGEVEYLWLPCSWLAPAVGPEYEVTSEGIVQMVHCEVRANIKATTSEELFERKKNMHLTAFRYALDDLSRQLHTVAEERCAEDRMKRDSSLNCDKEGNQMGTPQWTVAGYLDAIMTECRGVLKRHEMAEAVDYTDEARFRGLSLEVHETTLMASSKLLYWLDDPSAVIFQLQGERLREVHRRRLGYLARMVAGEGDARGMQGRALEVCKVMGLVEREVEEVNELGESRLLAAAADGRAPANVRLLAAAGADLFSRDEYGKTPMHAAAENGHADVVRALASLGAGLNAAGAGDWTPLLLAAQNGHSECVRALVEAKADVNKTNEAGMSPIYIVAEQGLAEAIRALVEAKADPDAKDDDGVSPIRIAAERGHAKAIRALIEAKADPDAKDNDGTPPIYIAAQKGHAEAIRALIEAKADPNTIDSTGSFPLYAAASKGELEVVRVLIEGKADLDMKGNGGWAPLTMAACDGNVEILMLLLEHKANITTTTNDDRSAMSLAKGNRHDACVELLRGAGASE